ncbi:hypothetical protein ABID25_006664 [Mesorhizobium abyssinicae]
MLLPLGLTSPISSTADTSLPAEVTDQEKIKARAEALGFIICRLDELRQMAASHGLQTLGCLLDVAFTESCDAIRWKRGEGSPTSGQTTAARIIHGLYHPGLHPARVRGTAAGFLSGDGRLDRIREDSIPRRYRRWAAECPGRIPRLLQGRNFGKLIVRVSS